ncbi:MAG: hypothetical protein JF595_00450, partial [Sphingomonadales bacterium]|nr:hypothetical protein [Sphingomonadales bacterium]
MAAHDEDRRLLDELEQVRTALESALEDNARLADDRDRLLARVTALAHELQLVHAQEYRKGTLAPEPLPP